MQSLEKETAGLFMPEPEVDWSLESASTEDDTPVRGWSKRGRCKFGALASGRKAGDWTWRKYRVKAKDGHKYARYMREHPYSRRRKVEASVSGMLNVCSNAAADKLE